MSAYSPAWRAKADSTTRASPSFTRSSSCSRPRPRTPPRSSGDWDPRFGSRTSTTGSVPSSTSRAATSGTILAEVPVIFVAFDLLGLDTDGDGLLEPLLRESLTERRRRLDALDL